MKRHAFTLVELLVVIVIIGMLASMSLGALYAARESAREAKSKAVIAKLDVIIQQRFEELQTRRLPFPSNISGRNFGLRITPPAMSLLRLQAIRWTAKTELPDHLSDVANPHDPANPMFSLQDIDEPAVLSVTGPARNPATNATVTETWEVSLTRSSLAKRLFRQSASISPENDNAELLYLIVTSDPEAREQFQQTDTADLDGDGCFEFMDGWGRPIKWLRWPTGYSSDLVSGDPKADHDTLDPRSADKEAFRTVPLIWSNGPDGLSGLDLVDVLFAWDTIYSSQYGKPVDLTHAEYETHFDNITNHALGMN